MVFFLVVIGAPFFFLGGPGYHGARSFVALWDLGHVLFFSLTSWLLCKSVRYRLAEVSFLTVQSYVFLAILVMGIVVETIQMGFDGRYPDLFDVFRNQLGCLIVFAFFCPSKKRRGKLFYLYQLTVVLLVGVALYPLSRGAIDEVIASRQFPMLSDFETALESDRWREKELISIEKGLARHGEHSLKMQLTTDTYSGVALFYFPGNWQGFESLHFSVYHPDEDPLEMVCRIHDADHNNEYTDRFNRRFVLAKGWNDLAIPLVDIQRAPVNRLLNLRKIESLGLFVVRQTKRRVVYIDYVYLSKK